VGHNIAKGLLVSEVFVFFQCQEKRVNEPSGLTQWNIHGNNFVRRSRGEMGWLLKEAE